MAVDNVTLVIQKESRNSNVLSIVSAAAPAINTDGYAKVDITAQAVAVTSFTTNLTGTPADMDALVIRIKDNGGAQTLALGAAFEPLGAALPTTTTAGKVSTITASYDSARAKWGVTSVVTEA